MLLSTAIGVYFLLIRVVSPQTANELRWKYVILACITGTALGVLRQLFVAAQWKHQDDRGGFGAPPQSLHELPGSENLSAAEVAATDELHLLSEKYHLEEPEIWPRSRGTSQGQSIDSRVPTIAINPDELTSNEAARFIVSHQLYYLLNPPPTRSILFSTGTVAALILSLSLDATLVVALFVPEHPILRELTALAAAVTILLLLIARSRHRELVNRVHSADDFACENGHPLTHDLAQEIETSQRLILRQNWVARAWRMLNYPQPSWESRAISPENTAAVDHERGSTCHADKDNLSLWKLIPVLIASSILDHIAFGRRSRPTD
ncbi:MULTISPECIES: hypothetical protein [unclassified Luteococcus]|uniref:hypothetical protein n=1 Tax=unclassified Luteococcus TaxID=2639923 RepID=UPI00313EED9A